MNYTEYYPLCTVEVLATGMFNNCEKYILALYETHLKLRDYGVFDPEGWEYEIDDSSMYKPDYLSKLKPKKILSAHPSTLGEELTISKDFKITKVYNVRISIIDTTNIKEV